MKIRQTLIIRLLWSLCLMQIVVLTASITGMLYYLIDDNYTFINDSVGNTLAESVELRAHGLAFQRTSALQALQAEYPGLWAVMVDARGQRAQLGEVPAEYTSLVRNLMVLGGSQISAHSAHKELTVRIEVKKVRGETMRLILGGAARSDFNRAIVQIIGILSPYFLIPLILFTLISTPIIVLRATRGVRQLAKDAAALDISNPAAHLAEESVPREIRPLVAAFNEAMSRLGKAYHVRDRFLRDAAHELRMPIAILMARIDGMPAHSLKPVLLTDLNRLANIAEQLLDLQHMQGANVDLLPTDLVALTREIVSDIAPLALSRCDDLVVDVPEQPVWILAEASALTRVIINLVQNALVHGEGGRITLSVTARGTFAVADQGKGVDSEEREHIFNPFYRGATGKPGHGLGLHLVREVVRAHKGRVTVGDDCSGGAVFTLYLQLASSAAP